MGGQGADSPVDALDYQREGESGTMEVMCILRLDDCIAFGLHACMRMSQYAYSKLICWLANQTTAGVLTGSCICQGKCFVLAMDP